MDYVLIILVAVHAMSGVFWAGSSGALANLKGANAETLFPFQMGSAGGAIVTGGLLFGIYRGFSGSTSDQVLLVGIVAALIAAVAQGIIGSQARSKLLKSPGDEATLRPRLALANRIAAGLLAITVAAMVVAKYF